MPITTHNPHHGHPLTLETTASRGREVDRFVVSVAVMASQQQARKPSAKGHEEERGQQGQAMNLEEIGKYRAEAQQRSADAIRAAEERFNRANQQRQHEGQGRAHGTVVALQEGTKPHPPAKQQHEEGEGHVGQESEAKQWLAETASDARERCNRAMGQGDKGRHQSYATAASRGKEEGGQGQLLTRQAEMGHGREAHKASGDDEAARAAVEKHENKGKQQAGGQQQQSAKDTAKHAADKGAETKDAGVRGAKATAEKAQETTQQATGTAVDYTKQATSKAKDASAGAAGTTAEYAKQAAAKTKDVTASAAGTTAEFAKAAAEKAKEAAVATARTTAGYTQTAAVKAKDAAVATGAQVAQKATEVTAVAAERVAGFAREKAEQGKEAEEPGDDVAAKTAAQQDSTADEARDVTGRYRRDDTAGGAAVGNKVKDAVAQKASDTVWRVKDTAKDAAGGVAQRTRDTASQVGHKAGEATQRAKGGHGEEEGGGGTTIVGDVLEAVGATVVGLAQHTKGIVAGEEEVVPGDVVETAKEKVAGAKEETKRKTA